MFYFQRTEGEQLPKILCIYDATRDTDLVELVDCEDYYFVNDKMVAHWPLPPRFPNTTPMGCYLTDIGYEKFKDDFQSSLYENFRLSNKTKNKSFFLYMQKVESGLEEFWDEVMKSAEEYQIQQGKKND